jgi:hypothetical protein
MVAQLRFRGYKPFKPITATGGTIGTASIGGITYRTHTFALGSSTFSVTDKGTEGVIEYLIVGGGGAGGSGDNEARPGGGGGGAGGLIFEQSSINIGNFNVFVGSGGAATNRKGNNGANSSFLGKTAFGGGAGGNNAESGGNIPDQTGNVGGSGGGGTRQGLGGNGTSGQGNQGREANPYGDRVVFGQGGGGGGAGGPATIQPNSRTAPGPGIFLNFVGNNVGYAPGGVGGLAGNRNRNSGITGPAGVDGTGGGGGGAQASGGAGTAPTYNGTRGGNGIVIVRYPITRKTVI